jgi:hypothetical protein
VPGARNESSPTAVVGVAPLTLAYDDLPPDSDLRREVSADGVTVIAPAGEVSCTSRRAVAIGAMWWAAVLGTVGVGLLTAAGAVAFWENVRRMERPLRLGAEVLYAAFAGGIFAMLWRARRDVWLEALAKGRRQSTILHATPQRLVVETSGPYGAASHVLPRDQIRSIDARPLRPPGGFGSPEFPWLVITLADGTRVATLPARDVVELRWATGALEQVLRIREGINVDTSRAVR